MKNDFLKIFSPKIQDFYPLFLVKIKRRKTERGYYETVHLISHLKVQKSGEIIGPRPFLPLLEEKGILYITTREPAV